MANILVTGGAGYIGSHIVVELFSAGHAPVILDDFRNSQPSVTENIEKIISKKPTVYRGDCTDAQFVESVFRDNTFDGVIHLCALKAVGESIEKPLEYYQNNIGALITTLDATVRHKTSAFVFSSSATVYGEPDTLPLTEESPRKHASSPYGNTKQIGEDIVRDVSATNKQNIHSVSLRYFNPIGAHPSGNIGELPLGVPQNLVPYLTQAVAKKRPPLTVFGNDYPTPDGTCIRDYIHVVDLARAHVATLEHLLSLQSNSSSYAVYNVGTGKGTSVLELIHLFKEATGISVPYAMGSRRAGDVVSCYADASKIKRDLGWASKLSIKDALRDAWKWEKSL